MMSRLYLKKVNILFMVFVLTVFCVSLTVMAGTKNKEDNYIRFNKSKVTVAKDSKVHVQEKTNKSYAGTVKWYSADEKIATVNQYGFITGNKVGTTKVY
ncbi:MAG: Ig-like domain-containing protein, partial [Eubacterium sp.]